MNEAKMKAKLAIPETTEEGPSTTDVSETESLVEDLPSPTGNEEDYSSDDDACIDL